MERMQEIKINRDFFNPTKGQLTKEEMLKELLDYFKEEPKKSYEIVVGCDSTEREGNFFVVVVALRKGAGGRFFAKKASFERKSLSLRERILKEVLLSCDIALSLREELQEMVKNSLPNLDYQFKYIHADIGENGATKAMIKEIVNLIKGNGFEPKIKPEAFAASVVADRLC